MTWVLVGALFSVLLCVVEKAADVRGFTQLGAEGRPNLILLLTDDQTMSSLRQMPYLTGRPGGHWVKFTNAFLSTPLCCPTRATLLGGRYAHRLHVRKNTGTHFNDRRTIAVWLQKAGYRTGFAGKYLNKYPFGKGRKYIPPGWGRWFAELTPEVSSYYDYTLNENGRLHRYGSEPSEYHTDVLTRKGSRFIKSGGGEKPFFLMLAYHAPHWPTTAAPRHEGSYASLPVELPPNFNERKVGDKPKWVRAQPLRDQEEVITNRRKEAEAMRAVDESLRRIIKTLRSEGELNRTVIIFMTDNGMAAGSHRWLSKKCVYEECIRTPFFMRYPSMPSRTESRLVASVDVAATLTNLANAQPDRPLDGRSLVPLLENRVKHWRKGVLIGMRHYREPPSPTAYWAIRTKKWKYVELRSGERELYHLTSDPFELQNKIRVDRYQSVRRWLTDRLSFLQEKG